MYFVIYYQDEYKKHHNLEALKMLDQEIYMACRSMRIYLRWSIAPRKFKVDSIIFAAFLYVASR